MSTDLNVNFLGIRMKTPIIAASGTFGFGVEYKDYMDLSQIGAISCKGIAITPWDGNEGVRIAETSSGILNCIGLENPGTNVFKKRYLPELKKYDVPVICNIVGKNPEEYGMVAKALSVEGVDAFEVNISCPNVKEGGIAFGQNPKMVEDITREIKAHAKQPVIMKLSPNVTDITEMARAAEAGGADGLSLINTLTGMKIDIHRRTFALANRTGGMSGPAVHPVAVRMVYQTAQAVNISIVGMGGIMNADDAIEMILAGATAVSVGTANFTNPQVTMEIVDGIRDYMERYQVKDIKELVGAVHDR